MGVQVCEGGRGCRGGCDHRMCSGGHSNVCLMANGMS